MPDQPAPVALITGSGRDRVGNVIARGVSCEEFRANVAMGD